MNAKITLNAPLAVSTDPVTGHRVEFFQLEDFATNCIDESNFKVKSESYIYSKLPSYNCENCEAYTLINPTQLSEVIGYAIRGTARKYDTTTTPFKEKDSQQVSFIIGKKGLFASLERRRASSACREEMGSMKNLLSGGSGLSEQYCMMSGSKAPDLDACGLFRAAHSHNPAR